MHTIIKLTTAKRESAKNIIKNAHKTGAKMRKLKTYIYIYLK